MALVHSVKKSSAIGEMYSYSGRGWKPTPGSSSSCGAGQSTVVVTSADHCSSKRIIREEEDEVDEGKSGGEETDVAAPLPPLMSETRQLKTKNTSAKDKRRLREKRRSTGVASLTGHEADEETTRNTSFNETAVVASAAAAAEGAAEAEAVVHQPQNGCQSKTAMNDAITTQSEQPIPSHNLSVIKQHKSNPDDVTSDQTHIASILSIHDEAQVSESMTTGAIPNLHHITATSSSFTTKNLCARPYETKRSILKSSNNGRPVAPAKPEAYVGVSVRSLAQCPPTNEDSKMLARVLELEKLLECERSENAVMKQFLSEKDSKIRDLELSIATLNEDLDLADEDYLRLEEENRALARAVGNLNTSD